MTKAKHDQAATVDADNDGLPDGAPPQRQWIGKDGVMLFEPLLDLGIDAFKARIAEDADQPIPEEKVAGLLGLERAGRNRTLFVQAMCDRLDVKSPYEVTNAGPGHTNDETPVTKIDR